MIRGHDYSQFTYRSINQHPGDVGQGTDVMRSHLEFGMCTCGRRKVTRHYTGDNPHGHGKIHYSNDTDKVAEPAWLAAHLCAAVPPGKNTEYKVQQHIGTQGQDVVVYRVP